MLRTGLCANQQERILFLLLKIRIKSKFYVKFKTRYLQVDSNQTSEK